MYKCRHFRIQELVDRETFNIRGERAWELLDDRALVALDDVRDGLGPTTVNNWHIGGDREWSGLRTVKSPYYSPYSQHSFGRAFDCVFRDVTAEEARRYIVDKAPEFITAIEMNVSWLHFDVRNTKKLKKFSP